MTSVAAAQKVGSYAMPLRLRPKVFVTDSYPPAADSTTFALESFLPEFEFSNVSSDLLLASSIAASAPAVVITDWICGPNGTGALIDAVAKESTNKSGRWIVFCATPLPFVIHEALRAGVAGVVSKGSDISSLGDAVKSAASGSSEPFFCPEARRVVTEMRRHETVSLTDTEEGILRWIAEGLNPAAIGLKLRLEPQVVQAHVIDLLRKTGKANLAELARHAFARGIASPWPVTRG